MREGRLQGAGSGIDFGLKLQLIWSAQVRPFTYIRHPRHQNQPWETGVIHQSDAAQRGIQQEMSVLVEARIKAEFRAVHQGRGRGTV